MDKKQKKEPDHKHLAIANHSPNQQRMFFGLAATLGYNSDEIIERAKKHFKTDCFNKLTKSQLMFLIDKLVAKVYR